MRCVVGYTEVPAEPTQNSKWPVMCKPRDLFDVEGLTVNVFLGVVDENGLIDPKGPSFKLSVLRTPRVLDATPHFSAAQAVVPIALQLKYPPTGLSVRCDFGPVLKSSAAQPHANGSTIHCLTPNVPAPGKYPFNLVVLLVTLDPPMMQRILVPVNEEYEFFPPAQGNLLYAASPYSAPVGSPQDRPYFTFEWRSTVPLFEVFGRVPYRCVWERTEYGTVTTAAVPSGAYAARCRIPVSSSVSVVSMFLEDPTGRAAGRIPLFKYFAPPYGTWRLPDGVDIGSPLVTKSVLRFETNGEQYPHVMYGRISRGLSIHCRFGQRLGDVDFAPLTIDMEGVECQLPDMASGNYYLSLVYDGVHEYYKIPVPLVAEAQGLKEEVRVFSPQDEEEARYPVALEPDSGPTSGGTMVAVTVHRPWTKPPPHMYCFFNNVVMKAVSVLPTQVICESPAVISIGSWELRLSLHEHQFAHGEVASLHFVYFFPPVVTAVVPAVRGVDIITEGLPQNGEQMCRVGMTVKEGVVLDHKTVHCPVYEWEDSGLVVPADMQDDVIIKESPRGGFNRALVGATIAVRSESYWYLHASDIGSVAAPGLTHSSKFLVVDGGNTSRVALYNEALGLYACPGVCPGTHPYVEMPVHADDGSSTNETARPRPPPEAIMEVVDLGNRMVLVFSLGARRFMAIRRDEPALFPDQRSERIPASLLKLQVDVLNETVASREMPTLVHRRPVIRKSRQRVQVAINHQDFGNVHELTFDQPLQVLGARASRDGRRLLFSTAGEVDTAALCSMGAYVLPQVPVVKPDDGEYNFACDLTGSQIDAATMTTLPPVSLVQGHLEGRPADLLIPSSPWMVPVIQVMVPTRGPLFGGTFVRISVRSPAYVQPKRYFCVFGKHKPVEAEPLSTPLHPRLLRSYVALRSVANQRYIYINNDTVYGVDKLSYPPEDTMFFVVPTDEDDTYAFYNVLHHRWLELDDGEIMASEFTNYGYAGMPPGNLFPGAFPYGEPPDFVQPDGTPFSQERARTLRYNIKDMGNGEVVILGNATGKMMRMSKESKLEVSDKLQPTLEERFVLEFVRAEWSPAEPPQEDWEEVRCRSPRNPTPEVVPFYVVFGPSAPEGDPPESAHQFEYVPAPGLIKVTPQEVPHRFTREQDVTVHLKALAGFADKMTPEAPTFFPSIAEELAGGLVELRGRSSGLSLCLEETPAAPDNSCENRSALSVNCSVGKVVACENRTLFRIIFSDEDARHLALKKPGKLPGKVSLYDESRGLHVSMLEGSSELGASRRESERTLFEFVPFGDREVAIFHYDTSSFIQIAPEPLQDNGTFIENRSSTRDVYLDTVHEGVYFKAQYYEETGPSITRQLLDLIPEVLPEPQDNRLFFDRAPYIRGPVFCRVNGIISEAYRLADADGLAGVRCPLPQLTVPPDPLDVEDVAEDYRGSLLLEPSKRWEYPDQYVLKRGLPQQPPNGTETPPTLPGIAPPFGEMEYDLNIQVEVSLNGIDGDFYSASSVRVGASVFSMPYDIRPLFGWASGGTLITLTGMAWPEDGDLQIDLIFQLQMAEIICVPQTGSENVGFLCDEPVYQDASVPCKRLGRYLAECTSPPAALGIESLSPLELEVRQRGDIHRFRLTVGGQPQNFTYTPVPQFVVATPRTAPIEGGQPVEIHGGRFDSRVMYWCGWLPITLPGHPEVQNNLPAVARIPAQYLDPSTLLCESPVLLAPAETILVVAIDKELRVRARGSLSFEFYITPKLTAVHPPRCLVGREATLHLEGDFPSEADLQCVFLDTTGHRDRLSSELYEVGPPMPWQMTALRTRVRLFGRNRAQCACPSLSTVVGNRALLRLAVGGLVVGGPAFEMKFERPPIAIYTWAIPMPYGMLRWEENSLQLMHQQVGLGGGATFALFAGDMEESISNLSHCAVGPHTGRVQPIAVHKEQQPNYALGGHMAVATCQLPTMPLGDTGAVHEVMLSEDGIFWMAAGKADVAAPLVLHRISQLRGQGGREAAMLVYGEGFVNGCRCAFVDGDAWDPVEALWNKQSVTLSDVAVVRSYEELHCRIPQYIDQLGLLAVAVVCPTMVVSSNFLWRHVRPMPTTDVTETYSVHRGAANQEILMRGSNLLGSQPLYCQASHEPLKRHPVHVWTDSLASCVLPSGPFDGLDRPWVNPLPMFLSVLTESGESTKPLPLTIDDPLDVHTVNTQVAYGSGGTILEIEGQNLPITTLWCRFGDYHVKAEVDPYSRQRRARCFVPPNVQQTTTMQIVSTADKPMSKLLNFTYRAVSQILDITPRTYIPYKYTLDYPAEGMRMVELHGIDFIQSDDCEVRFGDFVSPKTIVVSEKLIQTVLPVVTSNYTVPINVFCTDGHLQATGKDTLRFRFTHLPEIHSISPTEVEAQGGDWITLSGQHFEDLPGRACLFGTERVGLSGVRFLGPRAVRCRVPQFGVDVQNVGISFANDGLHFSLPNVSLRLRTRFRAFDVSPKTAFVASVTKITVVGRHFVPGIQCLFDEVIRVEPAFLRPEVLACDMPSSFRIIGAKVAVRLVYRQPSDIFRRGRYALQDRAFHVALKPRPRFTYMYPLVGTHLGGTHLTLYGEHLNFDHMAACIFGDDERLVAPANVTDKKITCFSVPALDGQAALTNITVRYFAKAPFQLVSTGLRYDLAEMPVLTLLHPTAIWRGKELRLRGLYFSQALPMHCRLRNLAHAGPVVEVVALVDSDTDIICEVPADFAVGAAEVDVTRNHIEWSNTLPLHIYGHAPVAVKAAPSFVEGYGDEVVRMALPAPQIRPGFGGGRCQDDESKTCLASVCDDRTQVCTSTAPASCDEYARMGFCGTLEFDVCCKRTCGFCADQLFAVNPPNLACLVDGWSLQPYAVSPSSTAEFAWTCSLPPLPIGNHSVELVLLSTSYRTAYPRLDRPWDRKPAIPIAGAVIESWGGYKGLLNAIDRSISPGIVYATGGSVITVKVVPADMVQYCRFGNEELTTDRDPDMGERPNEGNVWCDADWKNAPGHDCDTTTPPFVVPARALTSDMVECRVPMLPVIADGRFGRGTDRRPLMDPMLPVYFGLEEGGMLQWFPARMSVAFEMPIPTIRVVPQRGPITGGQEVTVYTDTSVGGMWYGVSPHANCLCRFGKVEVPATCVVVLRAVRCHAPPVVRARTVALQFSVNGGELWSLPGLTYEYYNPPKFFAIHPPLGSMVGGIPEVSLYGENFPAPFQNATAYCRWQGTYVVTAEVRSSSVLVCLVPSRNRFALFDEKHSDMPLNLEVSFAGDPPTWLPVDRRLTFYHYEVPVRKFQELNINPAQGLESVGGANLTVTGAQFVYPYTNSSLPKCIFGGVKHMPAIVDSPFSLRCMTPLMADIMPGLKAPAQVTLDVSFDSGITRTRLNSVYTYLKEFEIARLYPDTGLVDGHTIAYVRGSNFQKTPHLTCKFGDIKVPGKLISEDAMECVAPPQLAPGIYEVMYSVDGQTFSSTGQFFNAAPRPNLTGLDPPRGLRLGGTVVTIVGSNITWSSTLQCVFGYATVYAKLNEEGGVYCEAPPCTAALYYFGEAPPGVTCYGFVAVTMTFNGQDTFGSLTYEYVRDPRISSILPFPASGWNSDLLLTLIGENFYAPMWCKWWNLTSVEAEDVTPGRMRCRAPPLPEAMRPDYNSTGEDSLVTYVEVSPNDQDFTRFRFAHMYYQEPIVTDITPDSTFRLFSPEGNFVVSGSHFRLIDPEFVMCVWYYDVNLPAERTKAKLISRDRLTCQPSQPTAAISSDTGVLLQPPRVRLEISMSFLVDSNSSASVLAEDRMTINQVVNEYCYFTGGCSVILLGDHLWPADREDRKSRDAKLWVAVGDSVFETVRGVGKHQGTRFETEQIGDDGRPLDGYGEVASFRVPAIPHNPVVPVGAALWLSRNLQDRSGEGEGAIAYRPIPIGHYYRPELHNSSLQRCPKGHFCGGTSTNQTLWITSGEAPTACLPGTWLDTETGYGCIPCPEGVGCPRRAMDFPEICELGYICWGAPDMSFDANQALCPSGVICIRPPNGKTPIPEEELRRLQSETGRDWSDRRDIIADPLMPGLTYFEEDTPFGRRLRLATIPEGVTTIPCPAGYFCPPGTMAQQNDDGTYTIANAIKCSTPGVVCAAGSMNAYSFDIVPAPGEYINADMSGTIPCPPGYACPGGPGSQMPEICPPGQYQITSGAPTCATCTAGTICSGFGSDAPALCPAGRVCAFPGRDSPTYVCPAGSFCVPGTLTLNTQSGMPNSPVLCPSGTYCIPGTTTSEVNDTSPISARNCVEGTFCGANTTTAGGSDNCPPRWYCPRGVRYPQPAPPGHYVSESGTIFPSKCEPGSYAARWLMDRCEPCPPGTECPLDGTVVPTLCRPGTYREATRADQAFSDNVMCSPCPQGTWAAEGGLTSILDCKNCDERYVCPIEGITRFATIENRCNSSNPAANEICYENSQAWDCPQGYGCGIATASFTQYDIFCEPGFWCKVRTTPREIRNLLCPAGHYCKLATGESGGSGRKAFTCPSNHYCPEGTGAVNKRIGNRLVLILANVQADVEIITKMEPETGSMCRRCPENMPTGKFNITCCGPCGRPPGDDGAFLSGDDGFRLTPAEAAMCGFAVSTGTTAGGDNAAATTTDAAATPAAAPAAEGLRRLTAAEDPDNTGDYVYEGKGIKLWIIPVEEEGRGYNLPGIYNQDGRNADLDEEAGWDLMQEWLRRAAGAWRQSFHSHSAGEDETEIRLAAQRPVVHGDEDPEEEDEDDEVLTDFGFKVERSLQVATTTAAPGDEEDSNETSNDTYEEIIQCAPDVRYNIPLPYTPDMPCFTAVDQWAGNLRCPRGTLSALGARMPDDCLQQGDLIAVVNIYKCYPPRPCAEGKFPADYDPLTDCPPDHALCRGMFLQGEPIEKYKADRSWKNTYIWGDILADTGVPVQFLGLDPRYDRERNSQRPFNNITMQPMDIAILYFDFTKLNSFTRLNAGGQGHFDIHIHTSELPEENWEFGHQLPMFFQRSANSPIHDKFEIKVLAMVGLNLSVQIDLRHGGHLEFVHTLNESLDIKLFSPTRTNWGKRDFFAAIITSQLLLEGAFELPYNMPPTVACTAKNCPGDSRWLTIDASNTSTYYNAPQIAKVDGQAYGLYELMTPGSPYWSGADNNTVALPWLPFFSNCDGFDSHIHIWDLFESPGRVREGCQILERDEIKIVRQLPIDFDTMTPSMEPIADMCEINVECRFEEDLDLNAYASTPWFAIAEEEMTLFYLTQQPIPYDTFWQGNSYFDAKQGGDELVKVVLSSEDRTEQMRIPRRVVFDVGYYQETQDLKKIVSAEVTLSDFDDIDAVEVYYLKLKFEALRWDDLMNGFQLEYPVYCLLYCVIGLGSVAFTLVAWFVLRIATRKAQVPPFRLWECYEFLLWYPFQGVLAATVPVCIIFAIVKGMLYPALDPMQGMPCTYAGLLLPSIEDTEKLRCRNGRTGTCFMVGGALMLWSGSKLIIPALREVEEQFLLQQPSQMLNREGLPILAENRKQVRSVPIRWKRCHLIFVSMLLIMPLTMMWEFTYCDFFGNNAVHFIVGFNFAMVSVEAALSRAVREELLEVPLATACSVVLFVGTLGADDFTDFCEGFFIELLIGIVDRLVLVFVFQWIDKAEKAFTTWLQSRAWLWAIVLQFASRNKRTAKWLKMMAPDPDDDDMPEEVEGTPIEEAMEEILGCGTACMSTIITPFLILAMLVFAKETRISEMYGIRSGDLICYLLFGLVIAPFQVMMDILMNHATEVAHGVRIYDYMLYAKFRWTNRLTQWLYDDPRMDQSVAEPLQSVNHLCFSPQFYFIESYYTWGMLMVMLAVTTLLRWSYNPFDDPAFWFFIIQQLVCNQIMDKIIVALCKNLLWQPKQNAVFRVFSRTVAINLRNKDAKVNQEKYRRWFLERHTGWVIARLHEVFTPRSRERYHAQLSSLYQTVLMLQPAYVYSAPGDAFPKAVAKEELPLALQEELELDSSSDEEPGKAKASGKPGILALGKDIVKAHEEARERQAKLALPPPVPQRGMTPLPALGSSLPVLPALPPGSMAALPDAERWPIADLRGEASSGGFGPLASLVGRSWLKTVRRRIEMRKLADEMEEDWPLQAKCQQCGASEEDAYVQARTGDWVDGAQLKIIRVKDVDPCIIGFELEEESPPAPFDEDKWFGYMARAELWETQCIRCRKKKAGGGQGSSLAPKLPALPPPPPHMEALQGHRALSDAVAGYSHRLPLPPPPMLPALPPTSTNIGSLPPMPTIHGSFQRGAASSSAAPASSALSSARSQDEDDKFPELANVEVSNSTKELVKLWARRAKRQVQARWELIDLERRQRELFGPPTPDSSDESED
eukprot:TRINITY_DN5330_c0_g2_i1.p1 TRINITY_DN5330_c0_g2~~TRINITY_DN5330_c0_g2_i1.p1  ORF type:complete len:6836 (+),score=1501.21 TRINITY_DN5330_c0_g2_i1:1561-20508(+)